MDKNRPWATEFNAGMSLCMHGAVVFHVWHFRKLVKILAALLESGWGTSCKLPLVSVGMPGSSLLKFLSASSIVLWRSLVTSPQPKRVSKVT